MGEFLEVWLILDILSVYPYVSEPGSVSVSVDSLSGWSPRLSKTILHGVGLVAFSGIFASMILHFLLLPLVAC